ncbi:MAG TPA: hypothetical protein PKM25_01510 [Candidatus Ozemobacteraceae bacterium]|nr:hypothetical protein [Candidatus Ozemobacteraceae bacterium]
MTLKPIDMKTNLMVNNDASRIREDQKAQESGQAGQIAQQQNKDQQKTETIQNTQAADHRAITKEDEDAKRRKNQPDNEPRKKEAKPDEEEEKKSEPVPDGVRGLKIDIKI